MQPETAATMTAPSITDIFTATHAALAPLAGVTDSVFRRICAGFGALPVMTEMVSSDGLVRGGENRKTALLLDFHEAERPIGFQLFGSDPAIMAAAVEQVLDRRPDFIDINAGCPVRKVVGRGAGSALMRDPKLLAEIVRRVAAVATVPVTVKIRSGWDHDSINAVEAAKHCADAGADAVIVHPRTRSQGFGGHADHAITRAVKEAVAIPVIASGDIFAVGDIRQVLEATGADAVMIGRRAMNDPFVFRQAAALLAGEPVPPDSTPAERLELALDHLDTLAAEVSGRYALLNMRKYFGWYSKGAHGGAEFRRRIFHEDNLDSVRSIVRDYIDHYRDIEIDHHIKQPVEP